MATNPRQDSRPMTVEDYLEFEKTSEIKHEYLDGYIYAMAGETENYSLISTNLLVTQCRQYGCAVHTSNMRVQISESKYVYPDASIVCGEAQFKTEARLSLINPTIVIEVMSSSSEARDRGKKFKLYSKVKSLQHYILISQTEAQIDGFTRQPSGLWAFSDAIGIDATFTIETGDFTLVLADIYADIEFDRQDD